MVYNVHGCSKSLWLFSLIVENYGLPSISMFISSTDLRDRVVPVPAENMPWSICKLKCPHLMSFYIPDKKSLAPSEINKMD